MSQAVDPKLLELYQNYRYGDQFRFYEARTKEFAKAEKQANRISIGLIAIAGIAGFLDSLEVPPWLRLVFLLVAAICPVLFTALTAYRTLYGFEEQVKLYQDTINNLRKAQASIPAPTEGLSNAELTEQLNEYIDKIEDIFHTEQGQWGQLAEDLRPPEAIDR